MLALCLTGSTALANLDTGDAIIFDSQLCVATAFADESTAASTSEAPEKDAIRIEDIDWSVDRSVDGESRRVAMQYVNNSGYVIIDLELSFVVSPDATDEQLSDAFASMQDDDWNPDPVADATEYGIRVDVGTMTNPGETSVPAYLSCGGFYIDDLAQYELMTPEFMTIRYLHDDMLYEQTYDFAFGSYALSSDVIDINQWSDSDLSQLVPKPEDMIIEDCRDWENQFSFDTRATTQDGFETYVEACRTAGFNTDVTETDSVYYAYTADGLYELDIFYYPENQHMGVYVNALEQGITDVVGTMDECEEFFGAYAALLSELEASGNMEAFLVGFAELVSEHADMLEILTELDTSAMAPEDLAYYDDVSQRLLGVLLGPDDSTANGTDAAGGIQ